ncbi:hypothetical protein HPB49_008447 [Dermacentor silvarum]|uniref:Uncharacterized protein n=1 Tax=Dermacentor silvarum TaxID=543639 RepID=A0ACB8CJZ4_DERSI|nr:hypothetical protein HPB49_008447 [Dermacentor silvarum]
MNDAGMHLRKWSSNSGGVREELQEANSQDPAEVQKVLGLLWIPTNDHLAISMDSGLNAVNTGVSTKRVVLHASARVFDPLGLFFPFVVTATIVFHKFWDRGLGWDQQLPEDLVEEWKAWCLDIPSLREYWFPRCLLPSQTGSWQLYILC